MRPAFSHQTTRIVAALLALLVTANVQAQEITDGEAFYIYRNDGDFNGFFIDEVEEMRYSKLDLDSLLHDEYVVQEVVTADSIYRIPLAAIDSVGFVQPEIILNPRLKNLDELGITQYVQSYDYKRGDIWLYDNIPEELLPQAGDVLVSFDSPVYNPTNYSDYSGIGRKVTSVGYVPGTFSGYYCIATEHLQRMSDIFVQFISVEEVGTDESGRTCRRIAGYNSLPRKDASGGFTKTIVDVSLSPHLTFYPKDGCSISLDINLGIKIALGMVYQVRGDDFFIKASAAEDLSMSAGATLKVNLTSAEYIPVLPDGVASIKFPAFCPLFEIRPTPKGFIRYGGELYAKATLPEMSTGLRQSFTIDSDAADPLSFRMFERKEEPQEPNELIDVGDVNIGFNGFVQCGTMSSFGIFTNSWFSRIFSAYLGVDVYSGPKLEGNVNVSAAALANGDGAYSLKDCHLTFTPYSIDMEAKGRLSSLWGKDNVDRTFFDGNISIAPMTMWMFPTFTGFNATLSDDNKAISATVETDERRVFWGARMGIGLFNQYENQDSPNIQYAYPKLYPMAVAPASFNNTFSISTPGKYKAMPILETLGYLIPVQSMAKDFIVNPYMEVSQTEVQMPWQGGPGSIGFSTNGTDVTASYPFTVSESGTEINFILNENPEFFKRNHGGQIYSQYRIQLANGTTTAFQSPYVHFSIVQDEAPADIYKYVDVEIYPKYSSGSFAENLFHFIISEGNGSRIPCNVTRSGDQLTVSASGSTSNSLSTEGGTRTITYSINYTMNIAKRDSCYITGGSGYSHWVDTYTQEGKTRTHKRYLDFTIVDGTPGIGGIGGYAVANPCHYVEDEYGGGLLEPYHYESNESISMHVNLYRKDRDD